MIILQCAYSSLGLTDLVTLLAVLATAGATVALAVYTKRVVVANDIMIAEQRRASTAQDEALRRDRELSMILALYQDWKNEIGSLSRGLGSNGAAAIYNFMSGYQHSSGEALSKLSSHEFLDMVKSLMLSQRILVARIRDSSLPDIDKAAFLTKVTTTYQGMLMRSIHELIKFSSRIPALESFVTLLKAIDKETTPHFKGENG